MELKIKFSPEASKGFDDILEYIADNHGRKAVESFQSKFSRALIVLSLYPFTGVLQQMNSGVFLRKKTVASYTIVLYTFSDDELTIEAIFDGRKNWQ